MSENYYMRQCSSEPQLLSNIDDGYIILVDDFKPCPNGIHCKKHCFSVHSFIEAREYCTLNNHHEKHWHIKDEAKWMHGKLILEFKIK